MLHLKRIVTHPNTFCYVRKYVLKTNLRALAMQKIVLIKSTIALLLDTHATASATIVLQIIIRDFGLCNILLTKNLRKHRIKFYVL